MTEPIAWVVSTARYGQDADPYLHVRVLCPLCHLIHTHGGNTLNNPRLGGRAGHCGTSRPLNSPAGYDMAWPDDAGAKLLNAEMTRCHSIIASHGNLCSRKVSTRRNAGFYCTSHEARRAVETRELIDTSSIKASHQESVFTPKFDIMYSSAGLYEQFDENYVAAWDAHRRDASAPQPVTA